MKTTLTNLYQKENGRVILMTAFMDGAKREEIMESCTRLTVGDVLGIIDQADSWDVVSLEAWESLCETVGVDYNSFDDMESMFAALTKAANR